MVSPVVVQITARREQRTTMTEKNLKSKVTPIKELLGQDREFLKPWCRQHCRNCSKRR
jgi:hypothetical protein